MKRLVLASVLASMGLAGSAFAQSGDVVREPDQVKYKGVTVIDISSLTIQGELVRPDNSYVHVRGKAPFKSLIRYRSGFLPELGKSVDSL